MFRVIGITRPDFYAGEARQITELLETCRVDIIHLRKPQAKPEQVAALLQELAPEVRKHLMIHDFFALAPGFGLRGIHLNGRHPDIPPYITGAYRVSCGCHTISELVAQKSRVDFEGKPLMDYLFLSPVFDSISKPGYYAAFAPEVMAKAGKMGIIDQRVIALGGVTPHRFDQLAQWHFGGAAMLGHIWKSV